MAVVAHGGRAPARDAKPQPAMAEHQTDDIHVRDSATHTNEEFFHWKLWTGNLGTGHNVKEWQGGSHLEAPLRQWMAPSAADANCTPASVPEAYLPVAVGTLL